MAAKSEWWANFFDEAYVERWAEAGAFAETDQDTVHLLAFLDLPAGARVLDIPCGFGRFAQPLHEAGLEVVGVDASADQVRLAQERHPGPTYLVGDMREPPDGPFDAVLNLYSSFGYFADPADDEQCLRAWFEVLTPGGLLVIEGMHRDRVAWLWGQDVDTGGETGETDWTSGVRHSRITIGDEERAFIVRLYSATDWVRLLTEAGFEDIEVFGGLDRSPLDPSKRLAVRARRPG